MTIPELGTIRAEVPPIVVLTSNRTREPHDALKRRCLYHWIDYPSLERAVAIVRRRTPPASRSLAEQVASAAARFRALDLQKPPGVAEAINWTLAPDLLGGRRVCSAARRHHAGSALTYREDADVARVHGLDRIVASP